MHHFDIFKRGGHGHDKYHHGHEKYHHKRNRRHVGKYCEKFEKRGHPFKHMLRSLEESDLSNMNPQDPDIQDKMLLFVKEFFNRRFMERQAGNCMQDGAGEGTSKEDENQQTAANKMCMWRGRNRRYGWKGCSDCHRAGRNNSEDKTENATETQGKKSEEDTEEIPYCKHHHHHGGYERRHRGYGHGKCQGRFSGDESSTEDEKCVRRGRQHHHHHHHGHHHERHGYNHHWRMGWKKHGWGWFCADAMATVNKNADSGSQEPNQEVGGNEMQVDAAPAQEIGNIGNEERDQQEASEAIQEVAETLEKSTLE